jgi:hypothetical protein
MRPVPHRQAAAALVALARELDDVGVDLGLQCLGQHPPGTVANDLVDHRARRHRATYGAITASGVRDSGEHGRTFPTDVGASAIRETQTITGKVHPSRQIRRSQALLCRKA